MRWYVPFTNNLRNIIQRIAIRSVRVHQLDIHWAKLYPNWNQIIRIAFQNRTRCLPVWLCQTSFQTVFRTRFLLWYFVKKIVHDKHAENKHWNDNLPKVMFDAQSAWLQEDRIFQFATNLISRVLFVNFIPVLDWILYRSFQP